MRLNFQWEENKTQYQTGESLNAVHDTEWNMKPSTSVQPSLTGDIPAQVKAFEEFSGKDGKKQTLVDVENELAKLKNKPLEEQAGLI